MKGYYQIVEDNREYVSFRLGRSFKFPAHFHKKMEFFILLEGNYTVSKNGKVINLNAGDIAIFDSYDIHSYDIPKTENVKGMVLIFNTNSVEKFNSRKKGKKILSDVISNAELCQKIYDLGLQFIVPDDIDANVKECTAELIMSLLDAHLTYSSKNENNETTFVQNLLIFINNNFKNDLSLKTLSQKFGYSPEHISRIFHRYFDLSLPDYVNSLRLEYIEKNQKTTKHKITELLFDAGFNSIQTYYRAKKKLNS